MNEKTYTIYGLVDPTDKKIKYIGCSVNVDARYKQHIYSSKNGITEKNIWISDVLKNGFKPQLIKLDEITTSDRNEALNLETTYIQKNSEDGLNLRSLNENNTTTSFYGDLDLVTKLRTHSKYAKISFSEIVNIGLDMYYVSHKPNIEKSLETDSKMNELLKKLNG